MVMRRLTRVTWAAPATALGLLCATPLLLTGGRARRVRGAVEVSFPPWLARSAIGRRLPFVAITLGHIVVGESLPTLERLRRHELVHVQQFERWGAVMLLAYPLESAWQWVRGRRAYIDNRFEVAARAAERAP